MGAWIEENADTSRRDSVLKPTSESGLRQTPGSGVKPTPLSPQLLRPNQDYPSIAFRSPPLGLDWMGSQRHCKAA